MLFIRLVLCFTAQSAHSTSNFYRSTCANKALIWTNCCWLLPNALSNLFLTRHVPCSTARSKFTFYLEFSQIHLHEQSFDLHKLLLTTSECVRDVAKTGHTRSTAHVVLLTPAEHISIGRPEHQVHQVIQQALKPIGSGRDAFEMVPWRFYDVVGLGKTLPSGYNDVVRQISKSLADNMDPVLYLSALLSETD